MTIDYDKMKKWELIMKIMEYDMKVPYIHIRPKSNLIQVLKEIEKVHHSTIILTKESNGTIYTNENLTISEREKLQKELLKNSSLPQYFSHQY